MRLSLSITLAFGIAIIGGCTYNNEEDVFGTVDPNPGSDPTPVSLSIDIVPIINSNCAISGCHVATRQFPNLTVKSNIISNKLQIKSLTQSGDMPRGGGSLSLAEKNLIKNWVDEGGLDN